jgi:hypothetical protein
VVFNRELSTINNFIFNKNIDLRIYNSENNRDIKNIKIFLNGIE